MNEKMTNIYDLFAQAMQIKGRDEIARLLGLNPNTVARWCEQQFVPHHYTYDFLRLLGKKISPAQDSARDKNQFFTKDKIAKYCVAKLKDVAKDLQVNLSDYCFIEPAAGCGRFYDALPAQRRIGLDLDASVAKRRDIICTDFLSWYPKSVAKATAQKYVVVGNPPFGLRGHLALQFLNHAAQFADMTAFILPQLFYSDGKGAPSKRVRGYTLAHNEPLPADSFQYPNGVSVNVSTVFQVWTKVNVENIKLQPPATCADFIRVYSLSDGGTPASTRNKKMLYACDVYLPSTCFSGMRAYRHFEELPHRRGYGVVIHPPHKNIIKPILLNYDWYTTAFISTNGARNLRRSLIESAVVDSGFCDS